MKEMLDWLLPFILLIFGAVLGSFAHAFIYRYMRDISIRNPRRSLCENCHHELKWIDNIPIVSFVLLRGKCRYCHSKISLSHFLFEVGSASLFIILYLFFRYLLPLYYQPEIEVPYLYILNIAIVYCLIVIAIIDYKTTTAPLAWSLTLIFLLTVKYAAMAIYAKDLLVLNILGFILPLVLLLLIYAIFRWGYKKDGIGLIDIIIMSFIGLEIGGFAFLLFLIVTMVVCLFYALINRKLQKREIPLIPFIAGGYTFMLIGGIPIVSFLINNMGV